MKNICPHWFGWSYNTFRTRRFCRLCGHQQRRNVLTRETAPQLERAHELLEQGDKLGAQKIILAAQREIGDEPWVAA